MIVYCLELPSTGKAHEKKGMLLILPMTSHPIDMKKRIRLANITKAKVVKPKATSSWNTTLKKLIFMIHLKHHLPMPRSDKKRELRVKDT